jgi:hypothetical protein
MKKVGNIGMFIVIFLKFCQIVLIYCYLYHIFIYRVNISVSKSPEFMPFIPCSLIVLALNSKIC